MRAMNLKVEFGDDVMTFRVPWDYSMRDLKADCCNVWRLDPDRFVLEDGFDNVWPLDSIVTTEVKPVIGIQDDFDESPKLVIVDKEVALSMFDRETAEEKAAKRAASMVSDVFIGPVQETLVERSIRLRFDLAKELGPYICFILVFMGCIFMKRNVYNSFVMTNAVTEYFTGESFPSEYKPNVNFCFTDIANSEEMYQWMTGVFLGGIMDGAPGRLLRYFRVIGGIHVRTIKVKEGEECEVPSTYSEALGSGSCYTPWRTQTGNAEYEDKAPYSEINYRTDHLNPAGSVKPGFPFGAHGKLGYRYYWNENHANTIPIQSSSTRLSYGPNGFYTNLPLDEDYVTAAFQEFQATSFTDSGTRAVIITVLLFNQNFNLFDHVQFLFEYDAGGQVTPTMYQKSFRMDTYGEPNWLMRFMFDFLYVWFIILLYKNIAVKIHKTYLKTSSYLVYFENPFNFLDFCIAAVSTTYIVLEAMNATNPEKKKFDITTDTYVELGAIANAYELGGQLNAFNAFLVVMRTFEYLAISEPVQHLIRTLGLAAPECVSFSIMFLIIFYAFVIMANIVFGFIDGAFASMAESSITLLIMQLGEFDYHALVEANAFYAPIFFILFNIVIVFVLLNVFVGIIADAYEAAKHIDNDMNKDYLPSLYAEASVASESAATLPEEKGGGSYQGLQNRTVHRVGVGFQLIALANRPGFPFLGNDFFSEMGDVFASHVVHNPDRDSELALLAAYGPGVPQESLVRICGAFSDLRAMSDRGEINYPFSTREAVAVTKHLAAYPEDGVAKALQNVLAFDHYDGPLLTTLQGIMDSNGIDVNLTRHLPEPAPEKPTRPAPYDPDFD